MVQPEKKEKKQLITYNQLVFIQKRGKAQTNLKSASHNRNIPTYRPVLRHAPFTQP